MKVFVSGAAGFQGGNIAHKLIAAGHEVISLRRKPEDIDSSIKGLVYQVGDFRDTSALSSALEGVDAVVFTMPLIFDLEVVKTYTSNLIESAKNAGVDLIVFNPTSDLPKDPTGFLLIDIKIAAQELLDASGLKVITLSPDIYVDNISAPWSIPVIMGQGILPYPVSATEKSPFVSHADLGNYVVSALNHPELAGKVLPIGGNLWTGSEIAAAISSHIGKAVNFIPISPDDFQKELTTGFGELAAREISNAYRNLNKDYERIIHKDFAGTNALLSVQPQTLEDWVASVSWQ